MPVERKRHEKNYPYMPVKCKRHEKCKLNFEKCDIFVHVLWKYKLQLSHKQYQLYKTDVKC